MLKGGTTTCGHLDQVVYNALVWILAKLWCNLVLQKFFVHLTSLCNLTYQARRHEYDGDFGATCPLVEPLIAIAKPSIPPQVYKQFILNNKGGKEHVQPIVK
jgi:hypothetical protein